MLSEWFCCRLIIQEENKSQCYPFRAEWKRKTMGSHKPKYSWGLKRPHSICHEESTLYIYLKGKINFSVLCDNRHSIKMIFLWFKIKITSYFQQSYTRRRNLSHLKHMQWVAMEGWQFKVNVECHLANCRAPGNCSSPTYSSSLSCLVTLLVYLLSFHITRLLSAGHIKSSAVAKSHKTHLRQDSTALKKIITILENVQMELFSTHNDMQLKTHICLQPVKILQ